MLWIILLIVVLAGTVGLITWWVTRSIRGPEKAQIKLPLKPSDDTTRPHIPYQSLPYREDEETEP